jgi:ketosteroid isomerase-like protein
MSKKLLFIGAVLLALWSVAAAQGPQTRTAPPRKAAPASAALAEKQVMQVEHDWIGAYLNHDVAALENALADDWTYSPSDGSFKTRAQFVEEFRVDTMKYESITQNNAKVRVYGITAVVTGDEVIKGSDGAMKLNSHIRFTDVLVKRDDRWQAVASHESNILEPSDAPATP